MKLPDKIPKVTKDDVLRIIWREFPNHDSKVILNILNQYVSDSDSDGARVHLAAIKVSDGNIEKLREWIKQANCDFRDVLSPAEYPRFYEIGFVGVEKLSRKERIKLIKDDWKQYQEWLNKET